MRQHIACFSAILGLALALTLGCNQNPNKADAAAQAISLRDSLNTVIADQSAEQAAADKALLEKTTAELAAARAAAVPRRRAAQRDIPAVDDIQARRDIPAGTDIQATLETALNTGVNHSGDSFTARTSADIVVDGRTVIPAGAQVRGVLRNVEDAGRVSGRAELTLVFEQIEDARGRSQSLSAVPLTIKAASQARGDAEKIAAGTVLGAIVGGITNGKKGAVIGAGAGAGAGTVVMLATKGNEVELGAGDRLNIHTTSSTTLSR